eukprot:3823928-Prymnesium_polylepis.1
MNFPIGSKTSSTWVSGKAYQLFTDNEYVLNSNKVTTMIKMRRMKTIRNSCEYSPWQKEWCGGALLAHPHRPPA